MIETRNSNISLGDDGIIYVRVKQGTHDQLPDAQENVAAVLKLSEGRRLPCLVDGRGMLAQDPDAQQHYRTTLNNNTSLALAFLVTSWVQRVLGNFFLNLKSGVPVKLFSSEDEAVAWLKQEAARASASPGKSASRR